MGKFDDKQAHYDSLINFFKFLIGISLTVLSIFGILIGYITYSNGEEMRNEMTNRKAELEKNMKEMRDDLRYKEEQVMKSLVVLSDKVDRDIEDTRNQAIGEISNIKNHASSIAQFEANNKINEVFDENNIDQYIEKIAKERMEPKINDLVVSRLKTAQEEETDRAIAYIKNPKDASNYTIGYYYFQNNTQTKLSDQQVKEIIDIIKSKSDPNLESTLISMLAYRASPTIRNFFVEEIVKYPDGDVAMYMHRIIC